MAIGRADFDESRVALLSEEVAQGTRPLITARGTEQLVVRTQYSQKP